MDKIVNRADAVIKSNRIVSFNSCKTEKYKSTLLDETIIGVEINSVKLGALFDTGSEASLISIVYLNKYFPNWKKYEDLINAPLSGQGVNGEKFEIVATKIFSVKIGYETKDVALSISSLNQSIIFGLDVLKMFSISLICSPEKIRIFQKEYFLNAKYSKTKNDRASNLNKIALYPNQKKVITFHSSEILQGVDYIAFSDPLSPSIALPSICKGGVRLMQVLVRNDSRKKVTYKKNTIFINFSKLEGETKKLTDLNVFNIMIATKELPIPFYNKECQFNHVYYSKENETILRCNFVNNIFSEQNPKDENIDKTSLDELSKIEGLEIPKFHFPIRSVQEILDSDLPSELSSEQRTFLIDLFNNYPNIISQYSYDCGQLKDFKGNTIYMDIPLKSKLPKLTKAYKLTEDEQLALDDILNFLIYFGLAENVPPTENYGSPVFLVNRGANSNRPPRLIFDVRKVNEFIDCSVATYSDNVFNPLTDILQKTNFLSHFDISNAFFGIRLSAETLKTNISNIYCTNRTVRMKTPLTGISYVPIFYDSIITREMNLNDRGEFDPLDSEDSLFKNWVDDLLLGTHNSENRHKAGLLKFVHRLARLGIKINIKKSKFFINVKKDSFSLLGFDIREGKIVPNSDKLDCIKRFKKPTSTKEVQQFLGLINFLRNLLPLQAIHLTTILSPLSSNVKPFLWEDKHTSAFEKIKDILAANFSYTEGKSAGKNTVNIIYTDSSLHLMGALLFSYSTENIISSPPANLINIDAVFLGHLDHYKICCRSVPLKLENNSLFHSFIKMILKSIHVHDNKEIGHNDVNSFLNGLFTNVSKFKALLEYRNDLNEFFKTILYELVSDEFFFENFSEILALCGIIAKRNIKIIFGNKKVVKTPFYYIHSGYELDILIGFDCAAQNFQLLYILDDFTQGEYNLKSNNRFAFESRSTDEIFKLFNEEIKSDKASKSIRLVDQFSKSFAKADKNRPIFELEAISILHALNHFKRDICNAKLNIIANDSRVSFFLFSSKVQQSCKKLINWSLKLSLEYPNVRILNIRGKSNVADYLSRLGLKKSIFFARTLSPLKLNDKVLKTLPLNFTWSEIADYCDKFPDLISFSEEKMCSSDINKFYLSLDEAECPKINSMELFLKRQNFLDRHLSRMEIIKYQQMDNLGDFQEKNGVKHFNSKPILPRFLYIHAILREHFLSLHASKLGLENACRNVFHFLNIAELKSLISLVCETCLACAVFKTKSDKVKHGQFKMEKNIRTIQIDFIENLPSKLPHLLTIVDVYSRFLSVYQLPNKKASLVVSCLTNYFGTHGIPDYLVSDNYSGFKGKEMSRFLKSQNVVHPSSAPYRSRSRGLIENFNRLIQSAIKSMLDVRNSNNYKWEDVLGTACFLLNNRKFYGENVSAAEVHFCTTNPRCGNLRPETKIIGKSQIPNNFWDLENIIGPLIEKREREMHERRVITQEKRKNYDNKNKTSHTFKINDFVLVKVHAKVLGVSPKLKPKYEMIPYKILKINEFNAILESILDSTVTLRAVQDLKLISMIPDSISNSEIFKNVPKEALEFLELITTENLRSLFFTKFDKILNKRKTRQEVQLEKENLEIFEQLSEQLDEDFYEDEIYKNVRFWDD